MGNHINTASLLEPVSPSLVFLMNWSYNEIVRLFKNYSDKKNSLRLYTTLPALKQITHKTPLSGLEDSLFSSFHLQSTKLNLMELFASLIVYSSAACRLKVKLAFLIFDFDCSRNLNKAEMVILIISFIKGIASMTNSRSFDSLDLEPLGKLCFDLVSSNPSGLISLTDFMNWVLSMPDVVNLLAKQETAKKKPRKSILLKGRKKSCEERRSFKFSKSRRASSTFNSTLPYIKDKPEWENRDKDIKKLHELFYKHADDHACSPVGKIYQELIRFKRFQKESEFLFHEFDFDTNKLIDFSQLVEYIEKTKAKNGYFVRVGKDVVYPSSEQAGERKVGTNIAVLRKMFDNFDKNKDGFLNFRELKEGLKKHFTKQAVTEIFSDYDLDGNKLIDFSEFLDVFSPTKKYSKSK